MPAPLMVDATGMVRSWLAAQVVRARVVTETPADMAGPTVRVLRAGGGDDGIVIDEPTMVLHCFDVTAELSRLLALDAGAGLRALLGVVHLGAVLTDLRKLAGPIAADYANTGLRQNILTYQLRIKPA